MKHHTETISELIFTHFPSSSTERYTGSSSHGQQTSRFINVVKKKILTYRDQLQNGLATIGIGTILLITVYLFFSQLAEYGWQ